MTNAFEIAVKALFADSNLARDADYIPLQGVTRPVRVITRAPDVYQNVGISVIETPTLVLEVQVAECSILVPGDQFMINGIIHTVQGRPRRDSERLVWQVDVYAS